MDLDTVWTVFIGKLTKSNPFNHVKKTSMAGIPFLYLELDQSTNRETVDTAIKTAAVFAMKGKRLHFEMIFVRQEENLFVYRCRFFVPQEKMFCCGNLCHDCIRFR